MSNPVADFAQKMLNDAFPLAYNKGVEAEIRFGFGDHWTQDADPDVPGESIRFDIMSSRSNPVTGMPSIVVTNLTREDLSDLRDRLNSLLAK